MNNKIKKADLTYVKTIGQNYQWFILYEFKIEDINFEDDAKMILGRLIDSEVLNRSRYHTELEQAEIELSKEALKNGLGRPFNFEMIDVDDFVYRKSAEAFDQWVLDFLAKDTWERDLKDAKILFESARKEILQRSNLQNGLWHLSIDEFEKSSDKVINPLGAYSYYEIFIEIDRDREVIRTFDFGYD